jgi:hypothetical protein
MTSSTTLSVPKPSRLSHGAGTGITTVRGISATSGTSTATAPITASIYDDVTTSSLSVTSPTAPASASVRAGSVGAGGSSGGSSSIGSRTGTSSKARKK